MNFVFNNAGKLLKAGKNAVALSTSDILLIEAIKAGTLNTCGMADHGHNCVKLQTKSRGHEDKYSIISQPNAQPRDS